MEGTTLPWYKWMENSGALTHAFEWALENLFGPTGDDDPIEAITKLRQRTTVEEYQTQFEFLANRTERLIERFMIAASEVMVLN